MVSGFRKKGIVTDLEGRPAGGALIAVIRGTAAVPEIGIRADEAGNFQISLPNGTFTVEGHSPDGARGSIEVTETSSEPLRLRLAPSSKN